MDISSTLLQFLQKNDILSLATSDGKTPYVCNLHYISDEHFNLYFASTKQRKHSLNIEDHPASAVCIYDEGAYTDKIVNGVQMRGVCYPLNIEKEIDIINKYYEKFWGKFSDEKQEVLNNVDFRVFYKFTPKRIRYIDGHARDYPHEITLPDQP